MSSGTTLTNMIVILSAASARRSEALAESKDPYVRQSVCRRDSSLHSE